METVIAYIDDAAYVRQQLQTAAALPGAAHGVHWVLVACAPRMTHRISKWVSHSARENWRAKWSDKLFAEVSPWLHQRGDRTTLVLAKGPLAELSQQLLAQHGATTRVLDMRRPKLGQDMQPLADTPPADDKRKPWLPGTAAGMGMLLVLGAE